MPNSNTADLFDLVRSLDRSEKRNFRLFAGRLSSNSDVLFLQVFDLIDSCHSLDQLNVKIVKLKLQNQQLTNVKRSLHEQILKSLRVIYINKDPSLFIRKQIDYSHILYSKGLFVQALELLHKIRSGNHIKNYAALYNEVIEFIKKIESRHITRSRQIDDRMESLLSDSKSSSLAAQQNQQLLNLSLKIQGLYIKSGYAKDERDSLLFKAFFDSNIPELDSIDTKLGKAYYHQCHAWYNYANLQFDLCYKHAIKWVNCVSDSLENSDSRELYMRGMHYALTSLFYSGDKEKYTELFKVYKKSRSEMLPKMSPGNKLLDFTYYTNVELNYLSITNKFSKFNTYVKGIENSLVSMTPKMDIHRQHIIFYKVAVIYSIMGQYDKALDYLNDILSDYKNHLRKDLNPYTKLLSVLCHFRINNFQYVENQIDTLRIEFNSTQQSNKVVEAILQFLRRASKAMNFGIDDDIQKAHKRLENLKKHRYQKVAFIYYDYLTWMKSVLHNTSMEKVRNL